MKEITKLSKLKYFIELRGLSLGDINFSDDYIILKCSDSRISMFASSIDEAIGYLKGFSDCEENRNTRTINS